MKQLYEAICFRLINGPLSGPTFPEFAISKMALGPDDIVVLRFLGRLSPEMVDCLRKEVDKALPGRKCLVLEKGLDIAVLTKAEIERQIGEVAA